MSELLAFLLELLLDVSGGLVQTWFGFSNGRTGWQAASSRVHSRHVGGVIWCELRSVKSA